MKTTLYYFSLVSVLSLFACGSEQKTNERAEQATVPDSLKNERLIAAYYDDGTNCSVVFSYDKK